MSETIKKMIRSKFDKGIEIPNISLENINKRLKEMDEITNEMLNPFDSVLDKMVKDIRDRQDNVIAMEFTKCIGELLRKNGVVPKMTEYTRNFETDNTFETRYGVSIDELDFSAHDKVFEDKIAKLEKKNKDLESCFTQREQDSTDMIMKLKRRIAELERKNNQLTESILRQGTKIHELESKEVEKPTRINLDDRIKVKLTPLGAEIYYHQCDDIHKKYPKMKKHLQSSLPEVDGNGYTEFQLWHFIELYREYIGMCKKNVIDPLEVIIMK